MLTTSSPSQLAETPSRTAALIWNAATPSTKRKIKKRLQVKITRGANRSLRSELGVNLSNSVALAHDTAELSASGKKDEEFFLPRSHFVCLPGRETNETESI